MEGNLKPEQPATDVSTGGDGQRPGRLGLLLKTSTSTARDPTQARSLNPLYPITRRAGTMPNQAALEVRWESVSALSDVLSIFNPGAGRELS